MPCKYVFTTLFRIVEDLIVGVPMLVTLVYLLIHQKIEKSNSFGTEYYDRLNQAFWWVKWPALLLHLQLLHYKYTAGSLSDAFFCCYFHCKVLFFLYL